MVLFHFRHQFLGTVVLVRIQRIVHSVENVPVPLGVRQGINLASKSGDFRLVGTLHVRAHFGNALVFVRREARRYMHIAPDHHGGRRIHDDRGVWRVGHLPPPASYLRKKMLWSYHSSIGEKRTTLQPCPDNCRDTGNRAIHSNVLHPFIRTVLIYMTLQRHV